MFDTRCEMFWIMSYFFSSQDNILKWDYLGCSSPKNQKNKARCEVWPRFSWMWPVICTFLCKSSVLTFMKLSLGHGVWQWHTVLFQRTLEKDCWRSCWRSADLLLRYQPSKPSRSSGTSLFSVPRVRTKHGEASFKRLEQTENCRWAHHFKSKPKTFYFPLPTRHLKWFY